MCKGFTKLTHISAFATAIGLMVAAGGMAMAVDKSATAARKMIHFDRAALHRQAVEESLRPIRPGVPGERPFWNTKAQSFMYAPAFDFKPVKGAARYRFTATAYGTKSWEFDTNSADSSLEPIWRELPVGRLLVEIAPIGAKGKARRVEQDLRHSRWVVKESRSAKAPILYFEPMKKAKKYRFTIWAAKELTFEAEQPWAPLSSIWKDVPVGKVVLKVEGLDAKRGQPIGLATIGRSPSGTNKTFRQFHRKAVFNGPYHDAASNYSENGHAWLRWLAAHEFEEWRTEETARTLKGYPSKFIGAAISGMTALASMEPDPAQKKEYLQMAGTAARTLMAASFPADWGLAHFPPTYSDEVNIVMMNYPATAGLAYLDLYEATGSREMLDAARLIADTYKKTQRPTGSWPLLMDGRSGEKAPRSKTNLLPFAPLELFERLIKKHGFEEYRPMANAAWQRIEQDTLTTFRFEGQFEDTARGGGLAWNLSHYPACSLAKYLFRHKAEDQTLVALAVEALRFAEDQFVVWEQPVEIDVSPVYTHEPPMTPFALEQYEYMVPISGSAAIFIETYQAAFEVTGKQLYLAKAVAFANAMTVLQARSGGRYVGTEWAPGKPDGWPNVHQYAARVLANFGEMLRQRSLNMPVEPGASRTN